MFTLRPLEQANAQQRTLLEIKRTQGFDRETFVCHGTGIPIGYPNIEMEVELDEWRVFEHVNRDRGDSLLGLTWSPDAPEGWL